MSEKFNEKLSKLFGKVDDKVLQTKISSAIDMINKGETEELAKKMRKTDKDELLNKIDEFDVSKLKDLKIDKEELMKNMSGANLNGLSNMLGDRGDEIIEKIKSLLNKA